MDELLGAGTYGEVYRGTKVSAPDETFAVKMVAKANASPKVLAYLEREVGILQMLDSEHVVKLRDVKMTENHYYLIFEYCNGGDLAAFRKRKGGRVPEETVRRILVQVVAGLDAIYRKKAIHRDIKLSNILLHYPDADSRTKDSPTVKIGDFGFARLTSQGDALGISTAGEEAQLMSIVGTPLNMAPELLHREPYSFKADIWSLGTIAFELLCGRNVFNGVTRDELVRNIDAGLYWVPKDLPVSSECLDFLNACLQLNPHARIRWSEVLNHNFVRAAGNTPFDFARFRLLNPVAEDYMQSSTHYIFNSKVRHKFSGPVPATETLTEKGAGEENKPAGIAHVKTAESMNGLTGNNNCNNGNNKSEEEMLAEYVTIESAPQESGAESCDFTLTKLSSMKITDAYFP